MFELKSNEQNTVKQRYWTAETKIEFITINYYLCVEKWQPVKLILLYIFLELYI